MKRSSEYLYKLASYSLSHKFVIILTSGLWRSHHKTLQYGSNFLLAVFQKLLLQSLSNRSVACKRGTLLFCFLSLNFYREFALEEERIFFSGMFTLTFDVLKPES